MFIIRRGGILFLLYILAAVGVLVILDTPFNEGFVQSVAWLSAPIALLSLVFTNRYLERIQLISGYSSGKVWAYTVLTAALLVLMSWPYALLFNAVAGQGSPATLGGRVVDKFQSGRSASPSVLVLQDERSGAIVKLRVPEHTYAKLPPGSTYSECFYVGPLGFAYRWRYSESGPTCNQGAGAA